MAKYYAVYDTIIGDITLVANDRGLTNFYFGPLDPQDASNEENTILYDAITELNQFLFGQRKNFDIPLRPDVSEFEMKVLEAVKKIPYGHRKSYEEIAEEIGEPNATRAVGNALNKNPLPIYIPCHRVIGKNGSMVGYAGPLELKKSLLDLEANHMDNVFIPGNRK